MRYPRIERGVAPIVQIISEGAIATGGVGRGRLVPILIFDRAKHAELSEVVNMHQHVSSGDSRTQWGSPVGKKFFTKLHLSLTFERPVEYSTIIEFDIATHGMLIDEIIRSRGFYLQSGAPGDRVSTTQDSPCILVDAPDTTFDERWEKIYRSAIAKSLRSRGASRAEARSLVNDYLTQARSLDQINVRDDHPGDLQEKGKE